MSTKKKTDEMSFENAIERLEDVVNELENTEVDLDKALALYEEGIKLTRICNSKLSDAERKIEILKNGKELTHELETKGAIKTKPSLELFDV